MAVQPINFNTTISLTEINSVNSFFGASALGGTQATGAVHQTSSANISPMGQLLGNLQQLESQNLTEFSQLTSQIASQLQSAAQVQGQSGLSGLSQFLQSLASAFQVASVGGNLNALQTQLQAHHHHHQPYNSAGTSTVSAIAIAK